MQDKKQTSPTTRTGTGEQQDDNIDDMGRKPDGEELDQPGAAEPARKRDPEVPKD